MTRKLTETKILISTIKAVLIVNGPQGVKWNWLKERYPRECDAVELLGELLDFDDTELEKRVESIREENKILKGVRIDTRTIEKKSMDWALDKIGMGGVE